MLRRPTRNPTNPTPAGDERRRSQFHTRRDDRTPEEGSSEESRNKDEPDAEPHEEEFQPSAIPRRGSEATD